jgi:hypothetical protein
MVKGETTSELCYDSKKPYHPLQGATTGFRLEVARSLSHFFLCMWSKEKLALCGSPISGLQVRETQRKCHCHSIAPRHIWRDMTHCLPPLFSQALSWVAWRCG